MALAGGGLFRTTTLSPHCLTNMKLIQQFLPVRYVTKEISAGVQEVCLEA
jgi:RNA 3'-terminal phosphate cyclase